MVIKLKDILLEGSTNAGTGDAGEPETGYIKGGDIRHLGTKAGKPEPWYDSLEFTQMEFPEADHIFGKGFAADFSVVKSILTDIKNPKLIDILPERYIGSCVDVGGDGGKEGCDIWRAATDMATAVGNPDEGEEGLSKELSKQEFHKEIPTNKVKQKHVKGNHTYHYIAQDTRGREMTPKESGIFFIYNIDQDIHYFYRK